MKKYLSLPFIILLSISILVFTALAFMATRVAAQDQSTVDLAQRLQEKGVPVIQVNTISRIPYRVEIELQSSSTDDHLALDDNWNMVLASREATLAYRVGARLSSFTLVVYNADGDVISSVESFLYPSDLHQRLSSFEKSEVDNEATKEIVSKSLELGGLALDKLDVIPDDTPGSEGQILLIQVSTPDLETANRSLPAFMGSLVRMLDTINDEYGTYIVLCHLRVVDLQGAVLIDYVEDIEIGSTQWKAMEEGLGDWDPFSSGPPPTYTPTIPVYPSPEETDTPSMPERPEGTLAPTSGAYPPPSTPYP